MNKLLERFKSSKEAGEEGMALAGVVMLSSFVFIIVASLAMTSMISTGLTADNRSSLLTLASAESGIDSALVAAASGECQASSFNEDLGYSYEVFRSASSTAPINTTSPGVSAGCPQDGDQYIVIRSAGTDYRGQATEIVSTYQWIVEAEGTVDGALVSGGGTMNLSRLVISGAGADLVLMAGNFDCNNVTRVSGDLIVLNGSVAISNACNIEGSIYSSGSVNINNPAVAVGGDVYTLGNFGTSTAATISGDVYAKGSLTFTSGTRILGSVTGEGTAQTQIDNVRIGGGVRTAGPLRLQNGSVIGGNVTSSNTAAANVFNSTVNGSMAVGGHFSQLASSTVGGSVSAARAAQTNSIAPTATIGGSLILGGGISTWGAGPVVSGTTSINQTLPTPAAPTFAVPEPLRPNAFSWRDYNYLQSDWTSSGHTILTQTNCDYQNNATLVAQVNNLTAPTVIDMRGCGTINLFGVTFTLRTDVTFLANRFSNAQQLRVNSDTGADREFNMITPDLVEDGLPTCSTGQGTMSIFGLIMGAGVSGFIYSPCTVTFGGTSNITGQLYAGNADYSSGGSMTLSYLKSGLPGFPSSEGAQTVRYDADAVTRAVPLLVSRLES